MDFKHNWKDSIPTKALVIFNIVFWLITIIFLLAFHYFGDSENHGTPVLNIVLCYAIFIDIVTSVSFLFFGHDIDALWNMVDSFFNDKPVKPRPMFQSTLRKIAYHLYAERKKRDKEQEEQRLKQEKELKQQKEIILSKQILTNNLNHEIKTPIGIIQGYIDTLIEHDDEIDANMRKHFLKKCLDNTARLQNMAYSLSVITRIENGQEVIQMSDVNLVDTLVNVIEDLTPILEKAGITVENNLPKEFIVRSNTNVLYNIFSNLTKNAIFYSGGTKIIVELIDNHHLSFRDNGKGVEEQYLAKIFNRFYRVDSDKKRNLSSSGLGLAIVKESVEMHGWTVEARNHEDGGLQFIFAIPKGGGNWR